MTAQAEELAEADLADLSEVLDLRLYTAEQVVRLSGHAFSEYWLEEQAREGRVPYRLVGRSRRYARSDIAALWDFFLVPPTTEPPKRKK